MLKAIVRHANRATNRFHAVERACRAGGGLSVP